MGQKKRYITGLFTLRAWRPSGFRSPRPFRSVQTEGPMDLRSERTFGPTFPLSDCRASGILTTPTVLQPERYATWRLFFERKVDKIDKCIKKHTSNIFLEETLEKISKE
jgi:hypothetical protein